MERQLRSDLHPSRGDEIAVTAESARHDLDVVVFRSALVQVGKWRCPADNRFFLDSGPASDALFVFPRNSVGIEHEGRRPFVADVNTVTYYNKGQRYRRHQLSADGDHCDWYAVAPEALAETLALSEPAAIDRPDAPFPFTHGASDRHSYLQQRTVFHHVSTERTPDRLFVEEAVLAILADVTRLAYRINAEPSGRARRPRSDREISEAARDVIARRFTENLSLSEIAKTVGSSVFHLARVFKLRTGFSLHAYRNELRLRTALERLQGGAALIDIALDLGFSSHSHFTEAFRRTFGQTPSVIRSQIGR